MVCKLRMASIKTNNLKLKVTKKRIQKNKK